VLLPIRWGGRPRPSVARWGSLTRTLALVAALALLGSACTRPSAASSTTAKAPDLYAAMPSLSDVRALLGDYNWWPGPPSFGVRPLDVASMPSGEEFSVTQPFLHVGTAETFGIDYLLWNGTAAAKSHMTNIQNAFGTSVTGPKVGDQTLYYGSQGSGAAPYDTASFVRVGQVVATISWSVKDGFPKVSQLGKIATKAVSRLKDVISGKLRGSPLSPSDTLALPPAGLDITLLGTTRIPVEAALVMIGASSIDALGQSLRDLGVSDVLFGDYALDGDTHMEVRASVFTFLNAKSATDWLNLLRGVAPVDAGGLAAFYDAAQGQYMYLFASGKQGALLICRSTAASEAAARACEDPLSRVSAAWKLSLGA
jgi:hypothetical protein